FPAQHQRRVDEAGADESGLARQPRFSAQRCRPAAAPRLGVGRLFVFASFGHAPIMRPRRNPKQSPAARLLAWYDAHARVLPWRAKRGERADPYRVWLSEIMLQQTTVQAVAGYYRKFLRRWPNVKVLAKAPLDD